MRKFTTLISAILLLSSCSMSSESEVTEKTPLPPDGPKELATLAGGCFWCMEYPFERLDGVYQVISGYAGGEEENPEYKEVASGTTGHRESVQITYNPDVVSYERILDIFWQQVDPTDDGGQFVDRGFQYTTAIFYHNDEQRNIALASKEALDATDRHEKPIITPIIPYTTFYPAEDYHQDYYKESPIRYRYYRGGSGRDDYLDEVWGDERDDGH